MSYSCGFSLFPLCSNNCILHLSFYLVPQKKDQEHQQLFLPVFQVWVLLCACSLDKKGDLNTLEAEEYSITTDIEPGTCSGDAELEFNPKIPSGEAPHSCSPFPSGKGIFFTKGWQKSWIRRNPARFLVKYPEARNRNMD